MVGGVSAHMVLVQLLCSCLQQHCFPAASSLLQQVRYSVLGPSWPRETDMMYSTDLLPLSRIHRQVCATLATEKRALARSRATVAAWRAALESGAPLSRLYEA